MMTAKIAAWPIKDAAKVSLLPKQVCRRAVRRRDRKKGYLVWQASGVGRQEWTSLFFAIDSQLSEFNQTTDHRPPNTFSPEYRRKELADTMEKARMLIFIRCHHWRCLNHRVEMNLALHGWIDRNVPRDFG